MKSSIRSFIVAYLTYPRARVYRERGAKGRKKKSASKSRRKKAIKICWKYFPRGDRVFASSNSSYLVYIGRVVLGAIYIARFSNSQSQRSERREKERRQMPTKIGGPVCADFSKRGEGY